MQATDAWLMKAEPEPRIVKGRDVAFSVDDFEKAGIEHWDGVRNHEAKKLMKERMKIGDPVLFYHSNCKTPGIAAIAQVHKKGYPDFTAFDASHPYYDPKSLETNPTWYMVDVKFISRLTYFVPLKLLQNLANASIQPPDYISPDALKAIKEIPLLNRGRLSVQPVTLSAYEAIKALGQNGGWSLTKSASSENQTVTDSNTKQSNRSKRKPAASTVKESSRPKRQKS